MKKVLTSLFALIPLSVFSSHTQTQEGLHETPQNAVVFQVPERTPQEKMLEEKLQQSILEASRTGPLKNRIAALRLLNLMTLYESMVDRLRSAQKYLDSKESPHKLYKDIQEVAKKIKLLTREKTFASNYGADDLNQVYDSPPLSRALNKKVIESMGAFFYGCLQSGQLEIDTDALPEDFFPLKIFFLKDKEERAIAIPTSFVVRMPEDLNQSQSKLMSLKQFVQLPTGYFLPKNTYWKAVQDEGGKWYAQEVEWQNLLSDNLLQPIFQSDTYETDDGFDIDKFQNDWNSTLQILAPSFVVENKDSHSFFPFAVYYGADLPAGPTGVDMMIFNNHGNILYQYNCFNYHTSSETKRELRHALTSDDFFSPKDLYWDHHWEGYIPMDERPKKSKSSVNYEDDLVWFSEF